MLILILGVDHRQLLVFRGLLDYFIGIETALGMYIFLSLLYSYVAKLSLF